MANQPTYMRNDTAVSTRQAEVPSASFENGLNYSGSNAPGIGIANANVQATQDMDDNPIPNWTLTDQFGNARDPQNSQHIGGSGLNGGDASEYPINYGETFPTGSTIADGEASYTDVNNGFETINAPPDPVTWAPLPNDLNVGSPMTWTSVDMNIGGTAIAVSDDGNLSRSTDFGATWTPLAQGAGGTQPAATPMRLVLCIDDADTWIIGLDSSYLLRSTDDGATWTTLAQGLGSGSLTNSINLGATDRAGNAVVYLAAYGPAYTTDSGATWTTIDGAADIGAGAATAWSMAYGVDGAVVIGCGQRNCYRSTDYGATWTALPKGLTEGGFLGGAPARVNEMFAIGNFFVAFSGRATDKGSWTYSWDNGATWTAIGPSFSSIVSGLPGYGHDRNGYIVIASAANQVSTVWDSYVFTTLPTELNSDAVSPDFAAVVGHPNGTFIALGNETACRIAGV
jgi:hypothetical protein